MEATVGEAGWRNEAWDEAKKGRSYAIFRDDTVLDKSASERAGRPIYKPVVLLEKIVPGDSLNRPVRPMRDSDKEEFPVEWARFQQKQTNQVPGTPIKEVSWLSRTQIAEFTALNIFTVEQLATLPDSVANKIMGFNEIRSKANTFLKSASDTGFVSKLEGELGARDKQIAELQAQVKALLESQPATPQQGGRETLHVSDRTKR